MTLFEKKVRADCDYLGSRKPAGRADCKERMVVILGLRGGVVGGVFRGLGF